MDWIQIEPMDQLSVHDEEWLIENEEGTKQATGVYSCGELVDILDEIDIPNDKVSGRVTLRSIDWLAIN